MPNARMDCPPDLASSLSAFSHCALLNLDWERILDRIRTGDFPSEFYQNRGLTQRTLHADVEGAHFNSNIFSPHPRTPFPSTENHTRLALPNYLTCRGAEGQGGSKAEKQRDGGGVEGRRNRRVESQGDRTVGSMQGVSARVYDDGN